MNLKYLNLAFEYAEKAFVHGEVPIGAVIVKNNEIIGVGYNVKEEKQSVLAHAELIAINQASKKLNNWRLDNCDIYVTLDPCPMCASAIKQARIKNVFSACENSYTKTFDILNRVFDAFCNTGHFVFVVDNFDYIDGFSIEFLSNFVKRSNNWKNLKFVVIYNEHKPVSGFFGIENKDLKAYTDIHLAPVSVDEFEHRLKFTGESGTYVSKREQEIIFDK